MNVFYNMPIYSVLDNLQSINILLCANIGNDGTQTEKQWLKYIIIFIFGELRNPMEQREYLKQIHSNFIYKVTSDDAMFNLLEH